jgi:hypothetical protein
MEYWKNGMMEINLGECFNTKYQEIIHSVIRKMCHSGESRNPEKDWIPGQARNDRLQKTLVDLWQLK